MFFLCARLLAVALLLACALAARAAPYTPQSDSEVVERLPLTSDPSVRRVESLRRQLAARPEDATLRVEIARRYFELAMAQGDPRFVGYASSAIAPLAANPPAKAEDSASYWLVRGQIQQFSHDFEAALVSLAKASQLAPASPDPLSWRIAIFMVQARYAEALAESERLTPLAEPLLGLGWKAYVRATTGQLEAAFQEVANAVKPAPNSGASSAPAPEMLLWQYTRLADMAWRLQRHELAEDYFKSALKLGLTDQYLLGAYADFLLARQRPADVLKLLAGWERSDILLLRLALAGRAAGDGRAADWAAQLRDRFQAAEQRGDRLHEQEAARFELDIERNTAKALALASRNYQTQKEPRDAEILMRAALAANQAKAAQPALDWLRSSHHEDPVITKLAERLAAQGATR
jgi:tetratricopeptide (TPR) repeat protein